MRRSPLMLAALLGSALPLSGREAGRPSGYAPTLGYLRQPRRVPGPINRAQENARRARQIAANTRATTNEQRIMARRAAINEKRARHLSGAA